MESIPCILYPGSMDRISTQLPAMKVGIIRWQSQKAADKLARFTTIILDFDKSRLLVRENPVQ